MAEVTELNEEQLARKDLILRNLQEALGTDKLTKQLSTGKNIHLYWGTATTGKPHVGYMVPMQKIADFLNAGIRVTVLFADLHAFLDNLKSTFEMLEYRVEYYEHVIKALLTALNVPLDKLSFIRGVSYQLTEAYTQDVLKLCGHISQRDALRAGAEVVKQVDSPLLSGMLYPLLQAIDEQYIKVDGQFGGVDQRKIFILAEEQLPKIKLGKRWHLMNKMIPGLTGGKMSSSELDSKIDLLDSPEIIAKKIDNSVCERGNPDDNGVLAFFQIVVLPISHPDAIQLAGTEYTSFDTLKEDFESEKLSAETLKTFLKEFLINILTKVQDQCKGEELEKIIKLAYPVTIVDTSAGSLADDLVNGLQIDDKSGEKLSQIQGDLKFFGSTKLTRQLTSGEPIRVLWRVATKGRVNLGHVAGLLQLQRLQTLGCTVSILISDVGGFLDNGKCPWNAVEQRASYYEEALKQLMAAIGLEGVEIRHSKVNQYNKDYILDMYKMASKVTRDDSAIVTGNTLATHLIPIYHTLDVHYANVDLVITGEEQLPYIKLANELCKSVKYPAQAALLFPTIPGTNGKRMSASDAEFHLDLVDTAKILKAKIGKAFCEPGNIENNVPLEYAKLLVFPRLNGNPITIERPEQYGGNLVIANYAELEQLFAEEKLHPVDLKPVITNHITTLLEPARTALTPQTKLIAAAFPKVAKKK